jgi:hypothetical protein
MMEMLVGLAISAVMIGIVYAAYMIVGNAYYQQRQRNHLIQQSDQFNTLLYHDLDEAERIMRIDDWSIALWQPESNEPHFYYFGEHFTLRKTALHEDTFHLNLVSLNMDALQSNLINELRITLQFMDDTLVHRFQKQYAANTLMELEDEHTD